METICKQIHLDHKSGHQIKTTIAFYNETQFILKRAVSNFRFFFPDFDCVKIALMFTSGKEIR